MKKKLAALSFLALLGAVLIPLRYDTAVSGNGFGLNTADAKSKRLSAREQRIFRKRINERLQRLERMAFGTTARPARGVIPPPQNPQSSAGNGSQGSDTNGQGQ
jgi:hypothetical protein